MKIQRSSLRRGAAAAALLLTTFLAGCGGGAGNPTTHPVSGVLLYNGEPLPDASVVFYPEDGRTATGKTDALGRFTLTTFSPNDGAVAGQHKVAVTPGAGAIKDPSELTDDDYAVPDPAQEPFPVKYRTRETTDLTVRIPDDLQNGSLALELRD